MAVIVPPAFHAGFLADLGPCQFLGLIQRIILSPGQAMSWSADRDRAEKKNALRLLLDVSDGQFTRSDEWYPQSKSNIPIAVWSQLYNDGHINWYAPGGDSFRLTVDGWIEACRLLRDEIGLDERFGKLSAHLKDLGGRDGAYTHTDTVADNTGLSTVWVFDAIEGRMAERIYQQYGAKLTSKMGDVEIPPHIGKKLS